jgi:hypothetical protein
MNEQADPSCTATIHQATARPRGNRVATVTHADLLLMRNGRGGRAS